MAKRRPADAYIGTNNIEAGRALGRAAVQLLPGGGKAVAFVGDSVGPECAGARERIQGWRRRTDSGDRCHGGLRRREQSAPQQQPQLSKTILISKCWLASGRYNAPAIVDEVKAAGKRSSLKLVTFDAEPNTLLALKEGLLDATAVQNPYMMGYLGVKVLRRRS